ncbi:TIGR03084 family metal-binding protein [Saccharopolyspora taberi]|uniref:TIGR03084 family metal-binding protein n=1 Tax=Saccharopolyspora taberi TaxID=60895 RepID=UPI0031E2ED22
MTDTSRVVGDLRAEGDELDAMVADLPEDSWATATPAVGWTLAHQIAHLAWTDDVALLSVTDPPGFAARLEVASRDPMGFVDEAAETGAREQPARLLARWRAGRARLVDALLAVPPGRKLDWFGPPMSAASMATARIMETWAHGQDVADALGIRREPTARLRNVAHIGVRTRDFAYLLNEKTPPEHPFRVELTAPDGELWTWGPEDARSRITGPALDFCLLVTQRRHRDDLALEVTGAEAADWLTIAQAFAGPPGAGRAPGSAS